jgi:hypothetical protein
MNASGFAPHLAFSLQYPNLTPSHAEYAKIGTRSSLTSIDYYFTNFKYAQRWPEISSGSIDEEQWEAYRMDVRQLGDLLYRLIRMVSSAIKAATSLSLIRPPSPRTGV